MDYNWKKSNLQVITNKNKLFENQMEDGRSLHGVRGVDVFLLNDLFKLSTKQEKWTVSYSLFFIRKVNFLQVNNKLEVSRAFLCVSRNLFSSAWLLDQY